eukprot:1341470-Ditylum_brightwellii.AAC.1
MNKLANMPALVQKAMTGKTLDPAPFLHLYNTAFDLVRDIKVCDQLGRLGQIFAEPSSLYAAPAATSSTPPAKRPRSGATDNEESENQGKKKWTQQEGWLKNTSRGKFRCPQ